MEQSNLSALASAAFVEGAKVVTDLANAWKEHILLRESAADGKIPLESPEFDRVENEIARLQRVVHRSRAVIAVLTARAEAALAAREEAPGAVETEGAMVPA